MFREIALRHVPDSEHEGLRSQLLDRIENPPKFPDDVGGYYDRLRYDADTCRLALELCRGLGLDDSSSDLQYWESELECARNTGD